MKCRRCDGCLAGEWAHDQGTWCRAVRCLNCGWQQVEAPPPIPIREEPPRWTKQQRLSLSQKMKHTLTARGARSAFKMLRSQGL